MREALTETLLDLAHKDPRTIVVTSDLGFGIWRTFQSKFPNRFINVGIAEQNMIGVASGLAMRGYTVFTYSIIPFALYRCFEQIRDLPYFHRLNVKLLGIGAGYDYGVQGFSHHGIEDMAVMRALAELPLFVPSDNVETRHFVRALHRSQGPAYLRLEREAQESLLDDPAALGKARWLRHGDDAILLTTGGISVNAVGASDALKREGIACGVLQFPALYPFDASALLRAYESADTLVSVEEHNVSGGLGSLCAEVLLAHSCTPHHFHRLGISRQLSEVGDKNHLLQLQGLDSPSIADHVRVQLGKKRLPRKALCAPSESTPSPSPLLPTPL